MLDFSVTFLITVFNLALLFFVLRAILFKPVTKFMADREQRVRAELEHAAHERKRADELRANYEADLAAARAEADRIVEEAKAAASLQAEAIVEKGRVEAARLLAAARDQMEAERRASAAEFKTEAAELVLAAAGKVLRRETSGADARKAAQEFVAEARLA